MKVAAQQHVSGARQARRLISALLLMLFLLVLFVTQFEPLHHLFHCDAGAPDHSCAATLLRAGQVDACPSAPLAAPTHTLALANAPAFVAPVFFSFDFVLLPSCGPPAIA